MAYAPNVWLVGLTTQMIMLARKKHPYVRSKVIGLELQLKRVERGCKALELAVEIQKHYTRKGVRAARNEEQETATYLKLMGEKLEA